MTFLELAHVTKKEEEKSTFDVSLYSKYILYTIMK